MHATAPPKPTPGSSRKVEGAPPAAERARPQTSVANPLWTALATSTATLVQRTCAACAEGGGTCPKCEEEERAAVQTKLQVGPPGDRYEMEADRVADQVMRTAAPPRVQRQPLEEEEEETPTLQAKPIGHTITPLVHRQPLLDEDEEEESPTIQAKPMGSLVQRDHMDDEENEEDETELIAQPKAEGDATPDVSPPLQHYIERLPYGGQPLPQGVRAQMEPRFGYGFEDVRIHTDGAAQRSAGALRARAYTVGGDVVFGAGEYAPHTASGARLLAHELTHVVQQGAASPVASAPPSAPPGAAAPAGPQRTPDPAAAGLPVISQSDPRGAVTTVRRQEIKVGDTWVIKTPEGGNLLLRVQPDPSTKLYGEACGTTDIPECPNSVGNVASGTSAVVKEKRKYGWYVVETTTTTHGKRIGFVQSKYLHPVAPAIPEGAYDAAKGVCIDPGKCEAPPEEPDVETPIETEETPIFDLGEAALEAQEEGEAVELLGVIEPDDGANLWPEMGRTQPKLGQLPMNTLVFVDRKMPGNWLSVYVEKHQKGEALPVAQGTHGFIDGSRVNTDMPDPGAWFHRITKSGQGALALAAEVYPGYAPDCSLVVAACRDWRYLVNVLVVVNEAKKRKYVYKEDPDDDWDKAKVMKGGKIWVPGMELVKALETQVSSGSITLEILTTLKDIIIGIAAFIVGLLHGALDSILDIFIGIKDLIVLAKDIIVKLFKGTLVSDAKAFWEEIQKIKMSDIIDAVGAKWNAPSTWDRWKFRGYVIGYVIVEILLLVFSGGIVTAIKWAGKAGKFGKLAKYLAELPKVKKFVEAGKLLKDKGMDKIRAAMKAAEALSEGHSWAAAALRIPLGILKRLTKVDIDKLKTLPQWARERFAMLADEVKLLLLGCHSPCQVDPKKIIAGLKTAGTGLKLVSPDDVIKAIKAADPDCKVAKISAKLRKKNSALMTAIKEAGITDADLRPLSGFLTAGDKTNEALAYRTFVRYVTNVVPIKTPNVKDLNNILAKMVAAEVRRGSALKGAMFEQWVAVHIPKFAKTTFGRITFDLKKLIKKTFPPYHRHVDKWVPDMGQIWDMKHHVGRVPAGQVDDYAALIGKVAPDGNTVKSVNYLFPTKAAAEMNKHLISRTGFLVYYVDDVTNTLVRLY